MDQIQIQVEVLKLAKKEIGDTVIKLADVCYVLGISFNEAVEDRWAEVVQRDFVADRKGHGMPVPREEMASTYQHDQGGVSGEATVDTSGLTPGGSCRE